MIRNFQADSDAVLFEENLLLLFDLQLSSLLCSYKNELYLVLFKSECNCMDIVRISSTAFCVTEQQKTSRDRLCLHMMFCGLWILSIVSNLRLALALVMETATINGILPVSELRCDYRAVFFTLFFSTNVPQNEDRLFYSKLK